MSVEITTEWSWIDTDDGLRELADVLSAAGEMALDTESDGFHHYFDKLCLVQVSTRDAHFVVDPLAVTSLEPIKTILEDPAVPKVLHAAEQDLMYLRRDHDIRLAGLVDTLLGAQFLGHERLGLAALLEAYFDLKLSKSNQLDDWSRRPLTHSQLRYAVADTAHLLTLWDRLYAGLVDKARDGWAHEECRALQARTEVPEPVDPNDLTRIKGWVELSPRGRAILRELLRARDAEARRRDRPPFRVAGNTLLLALATRPPASADEVRSVKGFPRQRRGRLAENLLEAVRRGQELDEAEFPPDPRRRTRRTMTPRDDSFDARVDRLKKWRKEAGARLGLQPGVVAPQRDLETLAEAMPDSREALDELDGIRAWRRAEFGSDWLELLATESAPAD